MKESMDGWEGFSSSCGSRLEAGSKNTIPRGGRIKIWIKLLDLGYVFFFV